MVEYKDSVRMLQLASKIGTIGKENKYKSQVKSVYQTPGTSLVKPKSSKCTSKETSSPTANKMQNRNKHAVRVSKRS